MATTMRIKKGDLVQVLAGKDRGKQGRVLEARPRDGSVIVENLNIAKRHTKPRPIRDSSRMGGAQIVPGGIIEKADAARRLERDARLPDLQAADPRRREGQGDQGRDGARPRLQARRLQPGDRLMATATETYRAAPQAALRGRDPRRAQGRARLDSIMQVPRVSKITLNMGVGDAKTDAKALDAAIEELSTIAGQRAQVRSARKSIASFKLREGMAVGARVTLRGARMYEFLDRLVSIALPRIRDFRGLNPDSFDGRGNYSLGIKEQIIFPEIDYDSVPAIRGLDIAITTTAETDEQARALLRELGLPFATERRDCRHGQDVAPREAEAHAEAQGPGVHALQPLRPAAGRVPQVQALPDLPARARARGRDPGMTKAPGDQS